MNKSEIIKQQLLDSAETKKKVVEMCIDKIVLASDEIVKSLKNNGTLFLCGNGGSAADSQHIAAELIGRFRKERRSMPAIALTTDTSILTSLSNDYSFDIVFARQLEGLAKKGDVLIGISTSGNSPNVMKAIDRAKEIGVYTIGFLGRDGGKMKNMVDCPIVIPSNDTQRIQESHITIGHILCDIIEMEIFG